MAEGGGIEPHWLLTSPPLSRRLGDHSPAPSVLLNLVPEERLALSLPKELVSKTSAYSFRHPGMEHRSGLEPDKSGFAIRRLDRFGIQCSKTTFKLWLGRKDSNLRTLGSEPSAVAAVLLPNMLGCGTRYRAELSRASTWRFHLISFPAPNRPPSSILVSGCRMSSCDGRTWRARGESNPRRGIDSAPSWPLEDTPKTWHPAPASNRNLEFRKLAS